MSAGVVQLTARGVQDAYLNGKPGVSYFVGIYRRHSQFALQTSEYPFDSQVNFGDSAKVKIPYKGDLMVGASLKVTLPPPYFSNSNKGWSYTGIFDRSFSMTFSDGYTQNVAVPLNNIMVPSLYDSYKTISFICMSFTDPSRTFYDSIPHPYVEPITPPTINIGDTVVGLPYTGTVQVFSQITSLIVNNQIYYRFDVNLSTSQYITPITSPVSVTVSGIDMQVISASSLWWASDDIVYQTLDSSNHFNFKNLYPAIQTYDTLYMSVDVPSVGGIPQIITNGTQMSGITNYNLIFQSLYGAFYTTPISVNSGELFRTPLPVSISTFGTATANTSYNPHCLDFSNSYVEFSNIKFKLNNLSIQGIGNVISQNDTSILPIPALLQSLYVMFSMDTTTGLQNLENFDWLQVPYGFQYTGGDYVPGTTVTLSYGSTVIATAVAYKHVIGVDDFGTIPLPQGTTIVVVGQVSFVPFTPIYGLSVGASVSGPGHMQFIYSLACKKQPVFPITSPVSVNVGTVNFIDYSHNLIYTSSIGFQSDIVCTFWGFDPSTQMNNQIIPPTPTQTLNKFSSTPISMWTLLESGWVSASTLAPTVTTPATYVNTAGIALIDTVDFLIGGQLIESLTGEYIQNALDLKTSLQNKPGLTLLYGKDYTGGGIYSPITYIIPLPFYFYREVGLAVPLVSLYRQDVEMRFKFNYSGLNQNSGNSVNIQPFAITPINSLQASLVVDYAFLTEPELDYFRNRKLDYLITQVQLHREILPAGSIGGRFRVYFVNPVTQLQVLIRNNLKLDLNFGLPDYFDYTQNGLNNISMYFNGETAFSTDAMYLGTMEILDKYVSVPFYYGETSPNIYLYSFSTNPDKPTVPSGHVNMSRINEQVIEINLSPDATYQKQLSIYAINYNVLRVQGGLAGLLFNSSQ